MATGFLLAPGETAGSSRKRRARLAEALMTQGMSTSPVGHWTQGAARMAQGLVGGLEMRKLADEEEAERSDARSIVDRIFSGTEQPGAAVQPANTNPYARAAAVGAGQEFEDQGADNIAAAGQNATPRPNGATTMPTQGHGGVNPKLAGIIKALASNPLTAPLAQNLAAKTIEQQFTPKDPSYGVIGQDQYERPQYGWIDPRTRTTTPAGAGARQPSGVPGPRGSGPATMQPGGALPPPPPGVDPRTWRAEWTKANAGRAITAAHGAGFEDTAKLRKEVQALPSYKALTTVAPQFDTMVKAAQRDTRAADVSMVFNFMKMLDPTSVVRESEVSMAENVATLPQQYRAQVQSFLSGTGRLSPEIRHSILREGQGALQSYRAAFDRDATQYRGIAERGRMRVEDVLPQFAPSPELPKPPGGGRSAPTIQDIDAELRRRGLAK